MIHQTKHGYKSRGVGRRNIELLCLGNLPVINLHSEKEQEPNTELASGRLDMWLVLNIASAVEMLSF